MSIYKKLQEARIQLQSMDLKKSGLNKFAGYQYFELRDFLPAIQTIFYQCGICGVISFEEKIASLRLVDIDDNSEIIFTSPMGSAALKGVHEVQNIGAVETYQRRYLYVAAMEIVEHDALEATTGKSGSSIPESFKSSPTLGAMDDISVEEQAYMRELALDIIAMIADGKGEDAYKQVETEQLDDTQKTALWSLLDSKTRSAIKKAGQTMKVMHV